MAAVGHVGGGLGGVRRSEGDGGRADGEIVVLDQDRAGSAVLVGPELPLGDGGDGGRQSERGQVAALDDLDVQVASGGAAVQVRGERAGRPLAGEVEERALGGEPEPVDLQWVARVGEIGLDDQVPLV